jgi:hypothetical protein
MNHSQSVPGTPLPSGNRNSAGTLDQRPATSQVIDGMSVPGTPWELFLGNPGTVLPSLDGNRSDAGPPLTRSREHRPRCENLPRGLAPLSCDHRVTTDQFRVADHVLSARSGTQSHTRSVER